MSGEHPDAQPVEPEQPQPENKVLCRNWQSDDAPVQPQHMVLCRRCQRFFGSHLDHCPFCNAPSREAQVGSAVQRAHAETQETGKRVSALFWIFGILLLTNVLLFWYQRGRADVDRETEPVVRESAIALSITEAVDTVLVIFALISLRGMIAPSAGMGGRRRLAWLAAVPLLALLLAANLGYHWALIKIAGVKPETDGLLSNGYHQWWLMALCCIQPAIVEELFFRRLTFDFFRNSTTCGTAAFASAAMFAGAHTGALMSFPYFVLFGIVLAWLRWWSGSLALPMLMHFTHNLIISLHELAAS